MKDFWKRWVGITKRIASFQAGIVLILIYFVFIIPLAFIIQTLFRNLLLGHGVSTSKNTFWVQRHRQKIDKEWARQQ